MCLTTDTTIDLSPSGYGMTVSPTTAEAVREAARRTGYPHVECVVYRRLTDGALFLFLAPAQAGGNGWTRPEPVLQGRVGGGPLVPLWEGVSWHTARPTRWERGGVRMAVEFTPALPAGVS